MDILDIFLDILLKPPQPLMGLFFLVFPYYSTTNLNNDLLIITIHIPQCGNVMFSEASVSHSVHGGWVSTSGSGWGCLPLGLGVCLWVQGEV